MRKIAYLKCPSGIAGDMFLGALVNAGVPLDYLIEYLARLGNAHEYQLRAETVLRNGQQAVKVHVDLHYQEGLQDELESSEHDHSHDHSPHQHSHELHSHGGKVRHLPEIEQMIRSAKLPNQAEVWSLAVFRRLAEAEGAVHGISPEKVHFHEVGATDAIVDIVGTCLGLDWLKIEQLYCSPMPMGGGMIRAAHGQLAVPVPAVLKLWEMRGVPLYSNGIERELCTPTGVAIATSLATAFGSPPPLNLEKIGLGAGSRQLPIPNILQLWIGTQALETVSPAQQETVAVLETQIDDTTPQAIAYVLEQLLDQGALDVFTQPVTMKKSRLGTLLTVICTPETLNLCQKIIFKETSTLGIRYHLQQRSALKREIQSLQTPEGIIRVKVAWMGEQIINIQPEYDDCARLAKLHQKPWQEIHQLALKLWQNQHG